MAETQDVTHYDRNGWHEPATCPGPECPSHVVRPESIYGMCTACGAVEVSLRRVTGKRDLSGIGESSEYPTGFGCEVCA